MTDTEQRRCQQLVQLGQPVLARLQALACGYRTAGHGPLPGVAAARAALARDWAVFHAAMEAELQMMKDE